jgi:hypothetical protein
LQVPPEEEDHQEEWRVAVLHDGKYVNLLVGQKTDKDIRAERDEERTITIVGHGMRSQRKTSWPNIRSRRISIGLR